MFQHSLSVQKPKLKHNIRLYRYIVVDLMNGGDLRFHISRKTLTEEAVKFWIAELSCAILYIHGRGIVHRDIKPDNILLDAEGHVHLADFVRLFGFLL